MEPRSRLPGVYKLHGIREISSTWKTRNLQRVMQGSPHFVERMAVLHTLEGHDGCVNSVLFSDSGQYAVTGSDDRLIKIFSATNGEEVDSVRTMHSNNIFYAKDLPSPYSSSPAPSSSYCSAATAEDGTNRRAHGIEWILSCAADGKVALNNLQSRGSRLLYLHRGRAHRISLVPGQYQQFLSCGEDGLCCLYDLRDKTQALFATPSDSALHELVHSNNLPSLKIPFRPNNHPSRRSSIYACGVNPMRTYEVALAGAHNSVLLHDLRFPTVPILTFCPFHLANSAHHITGLKYNYNGSLLVATYNDDDAYTFLTGQAVTPTSEQPPLTAYQSWLSASRHCLGQVWSTMTGYSLLSQARESSQDSVEERQTLLSSPPPPPPPPRSASSTSSAPSSPSRPLPPLANPTDYQSMHERGYYQRYSGHRNHDTVKQINFLGSYSEFVLSGSDCGSVFIWDTNTSRLHALLHGDDIGAVNCLSPHPTWPMFATSGLESTAKIWAPIGEHNPLKEGSAPHAHAQQVMRRNSQRYDPSEVGEFTNATRHSLRRLLQYLQDQYQREEREEEQESPEGEPPRRRMRVDVSDLHALLSLAFRASNRSEEEEEEEGEGDSEESDDSEESEDSEEDSEEEMEESEEDSEEETEWEDMDEEDSSREELVALSSPSPQASTQDESDGLAGEEEKEEQPAMEDSH